MSCPLFLDCTRECVKEIQVLPADTFDFCSSERYVDCPFYRRIKRIGVFCENIANCPVYHYFEAGDFQELVKMTRCYCLSDKNVNCRRFILKKNGETVPPDLLPDGTTIK